MDRATTKYLARHAAPEADAARHLGSKRYPHCLVMPAYRETFDDIAAGLAQVQAHPFLLVLVVNAPRKDAVTRALLTAVKTNSDLVAGSDLLSLRAAHQAYDILLVDRCSPGQTIPPRQGVGLARKIGADIALAMMADGIIEPGFIYSTDADATLPPDYFAAAAARFDGNIAAVNFPFQHIAGNDLALAISLYEIAMLYYVAGLKFANSPYAHTTIGSAMAVNPLHYARVRGFPRRNAAEDFYLLNKLAKTGAIHQLGSTPIRISARMSDRVPFGTGPALKKILQMADPLTEFTFYDPRIFELLRELIEAVNPARNAQPRAPVLSPHLQDWAESSGLLAQVAAGNKRINDFLDGFRTLKLIHYLRDTHFPSVPLKDVVGSRLMPVTESGLPAVRKYLAGICFAPETP